MTHNDDAQKAIAYRRGLKLSQLQFGKDNPFSSIERLVTPVFRDFVVWTKKKK